MKNPGTITLLIDEVRAGKSVAASKLWQRYYEQLLRLARQKLRSAPKRVSDEEDVVLVAFDAFLRGVEQGRFPKLEDRDDLWQILVMLTARKAANQLKHQQRRKRGAGDVRGESIFLSTDGEQQGLDQLAGIEPSPEFAGQVGEECRLLLDTLGNENLRAVAIAKMEGRTNSEIAQRMGVETRTIERKLRAIRELWTHAGLG